MDSAREKLKRANLHLGSLSRFVRRFAAHDPYRIGFRVIREDDKRYATAFVDVWNPLPASIPLIAGDICNNLRLALDHLLRQCWLDAGPAFVGPGFAGLGFDKRVSFPIVNPPQTLRRHGPSGDQRPAGRAADIDRAGATLQKGK